MTDRQITHAAGCWSWGPRHYECAVREIERLRAENERLLRELAREAELRWEGNRRAAQEYVEDMRDVLREAAQVCKDLDDEALAKESGA